MEIKQVFCLLYYYNPSKGKKILHGKVRVLWCIFVFAQYNLIEYLSRLESETIQEIKYSLISQEMSTDYNKTMCSGCLIQIWAVKAGFLENVTTQLRSEEWVRQGKTK